MNEGGENDGFTWGNSEWWPFLNSNDQLVGSGEKLTSDKLPDSNTAVKEMVEVSPVGRKRGPPDQKENSDRNGKAKFGADEDGTSDREIHILRERERRKQLQNLFENLHALVPQLHPKADKSTIVDEAVNFIKALENTRDKLQQQKLERLQHGIGFSMMNNSMMTSQKLPIVDNSWEKFLADQASASNSAVVTPINHNNNNNNNIPSDFQTYTSPNLTLNVCGEEAHINVCCPKKPMLLTFICDVLEKHKIDIVSAQISSDHFRSMVMIQTHAGGSGLDQFSQAFSAEELYKQAAAEILSWINPN